MVSKHPRILGKRQVRFQPDRTVYTSGQSSDKADNTVYNIALEQKLPLKGLSIKGVFNYQSINTFGEAWNVDPIYYDVDNTVQPAVYTKRLPTQNPALSKIIRGRIILLPRVFLLMTAVLANIQSLHCL